MAELSVDVIFPIMFPLPHLPIDKRQAARTLSRKLADQSRHAFNSLLGKRAVFTPQADYTISKVVLHVLDRNNAQSHKDLLRVIKNDDSAVDDILHFRLCTDFAVLSIAFEVSELPVEILASNGEVFSNDADEIPQILLEVVSSDISRIFDQVTVVSNLAHPGSLTFGVGITCFNSNVIRSHRPLFNPFRSIEKPIDGLDYISMKFPVVWEWASARAGLLAGNPVTRVDRALSCFSHLFRANDAGVGESRLIWAITGLEALFADATAGIAGQIISKWSALTSVSLDDAKLKKMFSAAYNTRSRLLHGDMNLPSVIVIDSHDESYRSVDEVYEASLVSTAMLTRALQTCVKRRATDLKFKYVPIVL